MKNNDSYIKVLEKSDLAKLAEGGRSGGLSLSFYLGLKQDVNFRSEANSILSREAEEVRKDKEYSKPAKKKILSMLGIMKKEINFLRLPPEARTLILFLGEKSGVMFYRVPVYIPSKLVVEADFYIHPLVKAMEEFPGYLAVAVERNRAEFFRIFLGEIVGDSETILSDVPKKIRTSASDDWKGRRERRIERHIDDHLNRHFKTVASKIRGYFDNDGFDYLIIGGHKEMAEKFRKFLDKKSAEKLIGFFSLPHCNRIFVKEKSLAIIAMHESAAEERITGDLLAALGAKNKKWEAVAGADSVIKNIRRRNAGLLVVGRNFKERGYVCPNCHFISSYEKKCSECGGEMSEAGDLADEILEEAVKNKIKIKQLFHSHKNFDRFGIGAFLKYY